MKAQKSKPPLCHSLPDKFTSVATVAAMMESIFDELQVTINICAVDNVDAFNIDDD